jgi:hypothetical protein
MDMVEYSISRNHNNQQIKMDEMNQGTAHPTERATKDEAQTMDSKGMGVSKPTERVNRKSEDEASERRRQYREEREQELKDTLPRPSALSPETIQGLRISEETATWLSAYTKVQELYDWIYYAYVYRYSDSSALQNMMDDGVQELWSELADKVMKLAGDSMEDNLCSLDERKL